MVLPSLVLLVVIPLAETSFEVISPVMLPFALSLEVTPLVGIPMVKLPVAGSAVSELFTPESVAESLKEVRVPPLPQLTITPRAKILVKVSYVFMSASLVGYGGCLEGESLRSSVQEFGGEGE